jgi:hypothetical protein
MNIHSRSRLTPLGRGHLVEEMESGHWSRDQCLEMGISERTAYKWKARFRAEGEAGLRDRSSRPNRIPRLTAKERADLIVELRRYRKVERVMTDNGPAYLSHLFKAAVCPAQPATPSDATLSPPHQRQGRALHSSDAQ